MSHDHIHQKFFPFSYGKKADPRGYLIFRFRLDRLADNNHISYN